MFTLDHKIALITGAKGGLGTSVTQTFLEAGATVIGVSRSIEQSDFPHPGFIALKTELLDSQAARSLVDSVIASHGRIDAAVHLVGGFSGGKSVPETDDKTFDRMFDLNVKSMFHLASAVIPHMRKAGSGRILAIASRAAVEPVALAAAYNSSKAALISLIRTLALENSDQSVTANVILPGTMDTPANRAADPHADFSRWVQPSYVAAMLAYLASDAAAQVSGSAIPIYGRDL
jgi:NAD(P)-dependent dehydrogenase (short-subunit alcohol dehydrogenase family)